MSAPKHIELAHRLRNAIDEGTYADKIPGLHTLAAEYGVNFKTMNKAVNSLVSEGILVTRRGEGRFVASSPHGVHADVVAVLARTDGHLFADLAAAIVRHAQLAGLTPVVMDAATFADRPADARRLRDQRAGALIVDASCWSAWEFAHRHGSEFRHVVAMGNAPDHRHEGMSLVYSDSSLGMRLATERLLSTGRRKICLMHHLWEGPRKGYERTHHGRAVQGYRDALSGAEGAGRERFLWITSDEAANRAAFTREFSDPASRPDGIVVYMDYAAVWAYTLLTELGLRIPEDVAVIGHNNTPWCELTRPRLTSVSVEEDEIARRVIAKAAEHGAVDEEIAVPPELVIRDSCGGKSLEGERT